jgi:prevent-host-death family protein
MGKVEHMSVTEVEGRLADVIEMVQDGETEVLVEQGGRPVARIVPPDGDAVHAGRALLALEGALGEEGDKFAEMMRQIVEERHTRLPREPRV